LGIFVIGWVAAASAQKTAIGDPAERLNDRVSKLEIQVAALQTQIHELSRKASPRVLALPGSQTFPGNKIPPGATQHEINGLKYWLIPISEGH
jgi:hypothetical protein